MKMNARVSLFLIFLSTFYCVHSWPPALQNCVNTCFLNASIQVLYNIRPLTDILLSESNSYVPSTTPENYTEMIRNARSTTPYNYTEMIRKFETKKNDPAAFLFDCDTKVGVGDPDVTLKDLETTCRVGIGSASGQQEDATESIGNFLNELIDKNTDDKIKAKIKSLYEFNVYSKIVCPPELDLPRHESERTELNFSLEVQTETIQGTKLTTLQDCLKNYFSAEKMEGDNRPKDTLGNVRSDCTKKLEIQASPEILMIGLKRFRGGAGRYEKVGHKITIPKDLNIADYVKDGSANNRFEYQYTLKGVVIHSGSTPRGGHYYAYVEDEKGQWYRCDDIPKPIIAKVSFDDNSVIDDIQGSITGEKVESPTTGYFLVYQKISPEEIAKRKAEQEAARKRQEEERKKQEQLKALQANLNKLQEALLKLQDLLKVK